ncbi:MAG: hypothetical protein J5602_06585 [Clostridia bacterium]|nr:hypothetical protein [Clostridia bacterium]
MAVIDADVKRANGLRIPDRIHDFFCFSSLAKGYFTHRYRGLAVHDEMVYTNDENEALMTDLGKLPSAAVTRTSLRFFVRPDVTAIPLVSFTNMNQLMECCGAFIL